MARKKSLIKALTPSATSQKKKKYKTEKARVKRKAELRKRGIIR